MAVLIPTTDTGVLDALYDPSPSWPRTFPPQHWMAPLDSSDPSKATIRDGGLATGTATGNTTITATTAGFVNDNAVLAVK